MMNEHNPISEKNLPKQWKLGFDIAKDARQRAYVPYSNFRVGFALHEKEGDTFIPGVNVENASYGATICAERAALLSAISSRGLLDYDYGVLVTDADPPAVPCAECLQVLMELCGPDFTLIICSMTEPRMVLTMADLLPYSFVSIPPAPEQAGNENSAE